MSEKSKKIIYLISGIIAVGIIVTIILLCANEDKTNNDIEESGVIIDTSDISVKVEDDESADTGLQIIGFLPYSGQYYEDGSDETVENVLQIKIRNNGDMMFQYVDLTVKAKSGETYTFKLSTLLPGDTMTALESTRAVFNEKIKVEEFKVTHIALFENPPELHSDMLALLVNEGTVRISNICNMDISNIKVFYKNYDGDVIQGGITYMASVSELKAGDTADLSTRHFSEDSSRFVFVVYD